MKKILIFIGVFAPVLALLYFSLTRNPRELPTVLLNKPAPPFELELLTGGRFSSKEFKGQSIVLHFWSTWCDSCIAENRLFREAIDSYHSERLLFYFVLYEDTVERAREFAKQQGIAAPILLDLDLRTAIDYGVNGVPETFFIDRQGMVFYKHSGMLTREVLFRKLEELLQR